MVDDDKYHLSYRKHPKQDTGEGSWLDQYSTLTINIWNLSLRLQAKRICWWNLYFWFTQATCESNLFHGPRTDYPSDDKQDWAWHPPQNKELYSPPISVTHENKLPICHTLASSNLSLKWTKYRFPSGRRPISQLARWPFAFWLLLNEVSKICIVLGRKYLKPLFKEHLAPPYHYTIVQFKIHHLAYCSI